MSQGERYALTGHLDPLRASEMLSLAARELEIFTDGGCYDPVVWSAHVRYVNGFGGHIVAELTIGGVLRVRDRERDEILLQSKPLDFRTIDPDAPSVIKFAAIRARQRPIVEGGSA